MKTEDMLNKEIRVAREKDAQLTHEIFSTLYDSLHVKRTDVMELKGFNCENK